MFKRDPITNCPIGVLNDWDLAIPVDRAGYENPTSCYRTGTAMFMSLELLEKENRTVPHLYRHDLESFVWILIWCTFNFLLDGREVAPSCLHAAVQDWMDISWTRINQAKSQFLRTYSLHLRYAAEPMKPLVKQMVGALCSGMNKTFIRAEEDDEFDRPARFRVQESRFPEDFFTFKAFMEHIEPGVEDPLASLLPPEDTVD